MDEARIGVQGTLTSVWVPRGWRPTAVKQTRYEWVYRYAAVESATGFSAALLAPHVNTGTMNAFLKVQARAVSGTRSPRRQPREVGACSAGLSNGVSAVPHANVHTASDPRSSSPIGSFIMNGSAYWVPMSEPIYAA